MKSYLLPSFLFLFITCTNIACAAGDNTLTNNRLVSVDQWVLGVSAGFGSISNPLRNSEDIPLYILPDIRYYGGNFSIENLNVSYSLYEHPDVVVELVGQQNLDGLAFPGKNRNVVGSLGRPSIFSKDPRNQEVELPTLLLKHRSLSYMAGLEFRYYGDIDANMSITHDISNVHHGMEINASLHKTWYLDEIIVETKLGLVYKDADLTRYYYNAEYELHAFQEYNYVASDAVNYHVMFALTYPLQENWYLVSNIKNEWLDSAIHRSPIVTNDEVLTYFFGIKHLF